jgi:RecB family exonuclease
VDRVDEKNGEYFVVDFKTGKPKSKNEVMGLNENSDQNYLRQITFYKMFLELMDSKVHVNSGQINFVKRDGNGKRVAHTFELTSGMIKELKAEIDRVFGEIMSGEFLLKGCDDKDCEHCGLRKTISIK